MSIKAPITERIFELVPAGSHVARIYQVIDIGTEEGFQGKQQHKVRIMLELPNKKKVFREGEGEKPFSIGQEFTLSMFELANLRGFIEGIKGGMTDEEASEFDVESLLGEPCLVNIIHKKSARTGKDYAIVASASPIPSGLVCPPQINPSSKLSYDEFDYTLYGSLPNWLQERISATPEFNALPDSKGTKVKKVEKDDMDKISF